LSERGSEIGAYGTAWSDGHKNVQKGQQSVEKSTRSLAEGERDLARARADLAKAEQQISDATAAKAVAQKRIEDGKLQMTRAEADYAATRAGPSAVTPPN
jgi:predicted kinase